LRARVGKELVPESSLHTTLRDGSSLNMRKAGAWVGGALSALIGAETAHVGRIPASSLPPVVNEITARSPCFIVAFFLLEIQQ
jgi:hypothetical protein